MPAQSTTRVLIAGNEPERRRLVARLSRAGIAAAAHDDRARAELMVVLDKAFLPGVRERVDLVLAVGSPAAPLFTAGADDVLPPGEPELLFRRIVWHLEHRSLLSRIKRAEEKA